MEIFGLGIIVGLIAGMMLAIVCIRLCLGNKYNGFENDEEYYEWSKPKGKRKGDGD